MHQDPYTQASDLQGVQAFMLRHGLQVAADTPRAQ